MKLNGRFGARLLSLVMVASLLAGSVGAVPVRASGGLVTDGGVGTMSVDGQLVGEQAVQWTEVSGEFEYEAGGAVLELKVSGAAVPAGSAIESSAAPAGDGLYVPEWVGDVKLRVQEYGPGGPGWDDVEVELEDKYDGVLDAVGFEWGFYGADGVELDMSGCEVLMRLSYTGGVPVVAASDDDMPGTGVYAAVYSMGDDGVALVDNYAVSDEELEEESGEIAGEEVPGEGGDANEIIEETGPDASDFEGTGAGSGSWIVVNEFGTWLVIGSGANPEYEVDYWAWLPVVDKSGDTSDTMVLSVMDTSGGKLPVNGNAVDGTGNPLMGLVLDDDGVVQMRTEFREIYEGVRYEYQAAPRAVYIDKVSSNANRETNYELSQIWVLNPGHVVSEGVKQDGSFDWKVLQAAWSMYERVDMNKFGDQPELDTILVNELSQVTFINDGDDERLNLTPNPDDPESLYYILIEDGSRIRMVYEPVTEMEPEDGGNMPDGGDGPDINTSVDGTRRRTFMGTMYDYWITDGKDSDLIGDKSYNDNGLVPRSGFGINDVRTNLASADGTPYEPSAVDSVFAFGNGSTGTGLRNEKWNNQLINITNGANAFGGAVYGLVKRLSSDGTIEYADGVVVSPLFNEDVETVSGKEIYDGASLDFKQVGDTYTLQSVAVPDAFNPEKEPHVLENLDAFGFKKLKYGSTDQYLWSNSFWPMDGVNEETHVGVKGLYAKGYHTDGSYSNKVSLPENDDGEMHNCLFGMYFTVDFELTDDYCGPLEYLFFGDDDMWVFLSKVDGNGKLAGEGQLVCDIGGVHSSIGEYVDLWDWVDVDADGGAVAQKYRLSFFYTERGLSGSTCYMQFTLPSVSQVLDPVQLAGKAVSLDISKAVGGLSQDADGSFSYEEMDAPVPVPAKGFEFLVVFQMEDGEPLPDGIPYPYAIYEAGGAKVTSGWLQTIGNQDNDSLSGTWYGALVNLKPGERARFSDLPADVRYMVMETVTDGYSSDVLIGGKLTIDPELPGGYEITKDDGTTLGHNQNTVTGSLGEPTYITYVNRPLESYELPATGGPGIAVFIVPGIALAGLAACAFVCRRKREM